jgi:hypothetical protein
MVRARRFAWLISALVLLLGSPAYADDVQVGTGLVCDTQQQAERFAALYDGDTAIAIRTVNAEEDDPTACGLVTMAYMAGPPLSIARTKDLTFHIIEVLVIGVPAENGIRSVEPTHFFSVVAVEELRA